MRDGSARASLRHAADFDEWPATATSVVDPHSSECLIHPLPIQGAYGLERRVRGVLRKMITICRPRPASAWCWPVGSLLRRNARLYRDCCGSAPKWSLDGAAQPARRLPVSADDQRIAALPRSGWLAARGGVDRCRRSALPPSRDYAGRRDERGRVCTLEAGHPGRPEVERWSNRSTTGRLKAFGPSDAATGRAVGSGAQSGC